MVHVHDLKPQEMLRALSSYHDVLLNFLYRKVDWYLVFDVHKHKTLG